MIKLHHGDCRDILPTIADGIIDCVVIDPPYFGIVKDDWDNQWKTREDFIDWLEKIIIELKRVLKSNGSLYIFADDKICAYVQVMIDKHLTLLNSIVWHKTNNLPIKNAHLLRSYAPMTERVLFYTPQLCQTGLETVKLDINNFLPLREYFKNLRSTIGKSKTEILNLIGGKADHCFRHSSTQWDIPTEETYNDLIKYFSIDRHSCFREYESLRLEYESLRLEYESLRLEYESLRRTFNAGNGRFDVIQEKIITRKENTSHSTTKPTRLIKQFIEASTNKGDLVLDCFMGSGTTGVACKYLDRSFIGVEKEKESFDLSADRIGTTEIEIKKNEPLQVSF